MLPVGHVAFTWALLAGLQTRGRATSIDLRGAALAALLPDLVDKPLSLTLMSTTGTSQGLAHTLLVQCAVTAVTVCAKPEWLPYALVVNGHLLADRMWKYPRTLLFPFSRQFDSWKYMGTPSAMLTAYAEIITRPSILAVEVVGLILLTWVTRKGNLRSWGAIKRFLTDGKLRLEQKARKPCE